MGQIIVGKGVRPHHPLILPSHLNPLMQAIPIHPIRPTSYPQVFDERSIHQVLLLLQYHPSTLNPPSKRWAPEEHGYVCRNLTISSWGRKLIPYQIVGP